MTKRVLKSIYISIGVWMLGVGTPCAIAEDEFAERTIFQEWAELQRSREICRVVTSAAQQSHIQGSLKEHLRPYFVTDDERAFQKAVRYIRYDLERSRQQLEGHIRVLEERLGQISTLRQAALRSEIANASTEDLERLIKNKILLSKQLGHLLFRNDEVIAQHMNTHFGDLIRESVGGMGILPISILDALPEEVTSGERQLYIENLQGIVIEEINTIRAVLAERGALQETSSRVSSGNPRTLMLASSSTSSFSSSSTGRLGLRRSYPVADLFDNEENSDEGSNEERQRTVVLPRSPQIQNFLMLRGELNGDDRVSTSSQEESTSQSSESSSASSSSLDETNNDTLSDTSSSSNRTSIEGAPVPVLRVPQKKKASMGCCIIS